MNGDNHNPPQETTQVPITKQLTLLGVNVQVARADDGGRVLQIIDAPAGQVYLLPLPPEVARTIGNQLVSAVPVAGVNEMPDGKP